VYQSPVTRDEFQNIDAETLEGIHGFAAESDTAATEAELLLWTLTWFLHSFAAALYEITLSADIRFLMQLTTCTIIWRFPPVD
jgi:hypothetical protein